MLHFLQLRMDSHAQLEIRSYANVIGNEIVAKWCPLTWSAFNDYHFRRNALLLSARDKAVVAAITAAHFWSEDTADVGFIKQRWQEVDNLAASFGWLEKREDGTFKDNRERAEFEQKIAQLGLRAPWNH